jgi:hypothetical protein
VAETRHRASRRREHSAEDRFADTRRIRQYTGLVRWHRLLDGVTEVVLLAMIVFGPWAFGTTQDWAVWVMNYGGYGLGALLAAKWLIRWWSGYRPAQWGQPPQVQDQNPSPTNAASIHGDAAPALSTLTDINPSFSRSKCRGSVYTTRALAVLTILILAYCLTSALNARALFNQENLGFTYRDQYIQWLPHSYDAPSTWFAFWMYLGLAGSFWAARDWLLTKSRSELILESSAHPTPAPVPAPAPAPDAGAPPQNAVSRRRSRGHLGAVVQPIMDRWYIPDRLRRLLWVLCINTALLSTEAILQKLSGTDKLLWIKQPAINQRNEGQFGPYAYRSNAAQYINLVWPVCLGFWWMLRRRTKALLGPGTNMGNSPHVILLPCAGIMAASAIISISRGGALISILQLIGTSLILLMANRRGSWWSSAGLISLVLVILGFSAWLGWDQLYPRFKQALEGDMSKREEIYTNAQLMKKDFPWLGSGPGTFCSLYHLYRDKPSETWAGYLHDDWLETRITFGQIGSNMIFLALILALTPWFYGRGVTMHWPLMALLWTGLGGCLLHAVGDFPFQVHSILFIFLLLSCLASCASRNR